MPRFVHNQIDNLLCLFTVYIYIDYNIYTSYDILIYTGSLVNNASLYNVYKNFCLNFFLH